MKRIFLPVIGLIALAIFTITFPKLQTKNTPPPNQVSPADAQVTNNDWPQLQRDEMRSGRTTAQARPPLRARWIWFGKNWVLKNKDSRPGAATWDDDLTSRDGHTLNMPDSVPHVFAESFQPVVYQNKVFVADLKQEKVYALSLDDGETLWEAVNPGGTAYTGAAALGKVIFTSLQGFVTAWDASSGQQIWQVDTGKTISSSPAVANQTVYIGSQNGHVYAIDINSGKIKWQYDTGAPIASHPTVFRDRVYIGNEQMYAISISAGTGEEIARRKLTGQSFRGLWPVGVGNHIIFQTIMLPFIGSEYVYDGVLNANTSSLAQEQQIIRNWLIGSGKRYQHVYALNYNNLSQDYVIPLGPVGGVGVPSGPVVINQNDVPVTWWPTFHGTFSRCSFGCPSQMEVDLMGINLANGNGVQIPGRGSSTVTSTEIDNTYGLTIGGNIIYMRQNFRGTKAADMDSKQEFAISSEYRYRDGGGWSAPLNYAQGHITGGTNSNPWPPSIKTTPKLSGPELLDSRPGPVVLPNRVIFTEKFAVTVMESY